MAPFSYYFDEQHVVPIPLADVTILRARLTSTHQLKNWDAIRLKRN